jgi:hypothetical protein
MLTGIPFILVISVSETIALTSNLEAPSILTNTGVHIAFFHVSIGHHPENGAVIVE